MADDLRSKLNAKAEADRAQRAKDEEETRKYHAAVLREYPRLCKDLLDRVTKLVGGVTDLKIESQTVKQRLTKEYGSTATGLQETVIGSVDVPAFHITFCGKRAIAFEPAGTNIFGAHGAIDVRSTKRISIDMGRIGMVSGKDPDTWVLAIKDPDSHGQRLIELTDETLSQVLGEALG